MKAPTVIEQVTGSTVNIYDLSTTNEDREKPGQGDRPTNHFHEGTHYHYHYYGCGPGQGKPALSGPTVEVPAEAVRVLRNLRDILDNAYGKTETHED